MFLPLFIARRYFRAKKSPLVTLIGRVAVLSIGVSAAAMMLILSVMNGMNRFVAERFWIVDSDLKIEAVQGKFFNGTAELQAEIAAVNGVEAVSAALKDQAMLTYGQQNCMIQLEGVDGNFSRMSAVAQNVISGEYNLRSNEDAALVLMGAGVFEQMQIPPAQAGACHLYAVDGKTVNSPLGMQQAISSHAVYISGLFSSIPEYDNSFVFADIEFARKVFKTKPQEVSSLEVKTSPGFKTRKVQKELQKKLGPDFTVKDRIEQQQSMFKSMRAEKLIIMAMFAFIMLIATFTMVANQMLLMYEKRLDIAVLGSMGMTQKNIRRIFFLNGMLVNAAGTVSGLVIGSLIAFGQQKFGWVKLGGGNGNYITDAYPVYWQASDLFVVLLIGLAIGVIASAIPLRQTAAFSQRLSSE